MMPGTGKFSSFAHKLCPALRPFEGTEDPAIRSIDRQLWWAFVAGKYYGIAALEVRARVTGRVRVRARAHLAITVWYAALYTINAAVAMGTYNMACWTADTIACAAPW